MKWRRMALTLAFVTAAFLSVACGRNEYAARAVNEETDRCAYCNMAVADDAHATQIVLKDGRTLIFDDIGCMYAWLGEHGDGDVGASFVRDYHDLGWVKLEKAYYVYDASFRTPMAYGVLSFASKSGAEAFIAEQGKGVLMTADDLSGHSWERNRDMAPAHGEGAHDHEGGAPHADGADHGDADEHGAGHGGADAHGAGHGEGAHGDAGHGDMDAQDGGREAHSGGAHGDGAALDGANAHAGGEPASGPVAAA